MCALLTEVAEGATWMPQNLGENLPIEQFAGGAIMSPRTFAQRFLAPVTGFGGCRADAPPLRKGASEHTHGLPAGVLRACACVGAP